MRSADTDGKLVRSFYSQAGVLLYDENARTHRNTAYVYLSGDPLAERRTDTATNTTATWYVHTDLLGSPVAWTDPARAVHDRIDYAPYGLPLTGAMEGVSYTGHVMDQASGLIYAQQRYYDPRVGRFLSPDPVDTDAGTGGNFNRYWYANNNPFRFTDPDGRQSCLPQCQQSVHGQVNTSGQNAANLANQAVSAPARAAGAYTNTVNSATSNGTVLGPLKDGQVLTPSTPTANHGPYKADTTGGIGLEGAFQFPLVGVEISTGIVSAPDGTRPFVGFKVSSPSPAAGAHLGVSVISSTANSLGEFGGLSLGHSGGAGEVIYGGIGVDVGAGDRGRLVETTTVTVGVGEGIDHGTNYGGTYVIGAP